MCYVIFNVQLLKEKKTEQLHIIVKKIGKRRKFCNIISEIGQDFQDNLANLFYSIFNNVNKNNYDGFTSV